MNGLASSLPESSAFIKQARVYNVALIVSVLVFLVIWASGLKILERLGRLPAPPITATNCIDEKFKFLHELDLGQVNMLTVGSSAAWRSVDLRPFKRHYGPGLHPLNAAPCYLRMNQIAFLTNFYLNHLPKVRTVIGVFAMRDFAECATNPMEFFDRHDAARYVFDKAPSWHLYVKNFRPGSFFKDVLELPEIRTRNNVQEALKMDRYGSAPLHIDTPEVRDDVIMDPTCLQALSAMSKNLARRGVRFIVVLLPPMPSWLERYDPNGVRDRKYRQFVATALDPSQAVLIDAAKALRPDDKYFTDPAHIQRDSVPSFMRFIIDGIERAGVAHVLNRAL